MPNTLNWTKRQPEMYGNLYIMQRYRIGHVFELQGGGYIRFLLPINVPQARPDDFVEHLVFGYRRAVPGDTNTVYDTFIRRSVPGDTKEAYETYVAEVKRSSELPARRRTE